MDKSKVPRFYGHPVQWRYPTRWTFAYG